MSFPYTLTESVEILLQLIYSPIDEVSYDYGLQKDETKKRMRLLCCEIFQNCRWENGFPVMDKTPFRGQMVNALRNLRRRDPIMWDFVFDTNVPGALQIILDHVWYLLTEIMGYTYEEIVEFKERLLGKDGHLFQIQKIISEKDIMFCMEEVISETSTVLLYEVSHTARKKVMKYTIAHKKNMYFTPTIEDITLQGCTEKHLLDTPLLKYNYVYETPTEYTGKRLFDVVFSLALILVTSPFMLMTALAIKLEDGGPVFFKQRRCTKGGREFEIVKFRSMVVDAEKYGVTPCTENDSRITKVGNIIRKTRLDELPQLFNILKGDMCFVGPRPERVEHVEKYTKELPEFTYRMRVKGGLTGYAQIYGKYNTSAYDKLRLDLTYIENQSFFLDLKLILLTLKIMFVPESTEGFGKEKSLAMREETLGKKAVGETRMRTGQVAR